MFSLLTFFVPVIMVFNIMVSVELAAATPCPSSQTCYATRQEKLAVSPEIAVLYPPEVAGLVHQCFSNKVRSSMWSALLPNRPDSQRADKPAPGCVAAWLLHCWSKDVF